MRPKEIEVICESLTIEVGDFYWTGEALVDAKALIDYVKSLEEKLEAKITTAEAFGVLTKALQDDEGYAWGWHCNLAMAAFDQGVDHATANKAAAAFMKLCFGVETKEPQVMGGEQVAPPEGHDFVGTLGEGG